MVYVKCGAQILLVDDDKADKYKSQGFEIYVPPQPAAPEVEPEEKRETPKPEPPQDKPKGGKKDAKDNK